MGDEIKRPVLAAPAQRKRRRRVSPAEQQARIASLPSRKGPCEVDKRKGEVRYFVAAKLPRHMYLCDEHYIEIRGKLENALAKIVQELFPRETPKE